MSYRILVVDDDPAVCRVLRDAFERQSWHVTECDGGAEALETLTRHRFDLVVLDVFMEPVGGLEVLPAYFGAKLPPISVQSYH
jgi:CheY-like chemotaxis protein